MAKARKHDSAVTPDTIVYVVDDDHAMRESLAYLITSHGLHVETFASAETFLDHYKEGRHACLVLDVRMPGMSGLELQKLLAERQSKLPVILLTAHGDVPMAVKAMRAGAFDFVEKPGNGHMLLERILRALEQSRQAQADKQRVETVQAAIEELSRRERQVMDLVVAGKLNKQIAAELGISIKTVEVHRARMMAKMKAENLADLVRMVLDARQA
ncbi:MAG: response regulator [Planctomycetes bacterium]|nr:response regulator [Planctomycetota bacterium]